MLELALPRASSSCGGLHPPAASVVPPAHRHSVAPPFDFAARHDERNPLQTPTR
jgi:hypothetical protein